MPNHSEIMWLAGYLEGEGCFAAQKDYRYKNIYSYRITVASTDYDVIRKASAILGSNSISTIRGNVRNGISRKVAYTTRVNGKLAVQWMMTLYVLMGNRRREKIREILSRWRLHA